MANIGGGAAGGGGGGGLQHQSVNVRSVAGDSPGGKVSKHHSLVAGGYRWNGLIEKMKGRVQTFEDAYCPDAEVIALFIPRKCFTKSAIRWNQWRTDASMADNVKTFQLALGGFCCMCTSMASFNPPNRYAKCCGHASDGEPHLRSIATITVVPPRGKITEENRAVLDRGIPDASDELGMAQYTRAIEETELRQNDEVGFILTASYAFVGNEDDDLEPELTDKPPTGPQIARQKRITAQRMAQRDPKWIMREQIGTVDTAECDAATKPPKRVYTISGVQPRTAFQMLNKEKYISVMSAYRPHVFNEDHAMMLDIADEDSPINPYNCYSLKDALTLAVRHGGDVNFCKPSSWERQRTATSASRNYAFPLDGRFTQRLLFSELKYDQLMQHFLVTFPRPDISARLGADLDTVIQSYVPSAHDPRDEGEDADEDGDAEMKGDEADGKESKARLAGIQRAGRVFLRSGLTSAVANDWQALRYDVETMFKPALRAAALNPNVSLHERAQLRRDMQLFCVSRAKLIFQADNHDLSDAGRAVAKCFEEISTKLPSMRIPVAKHTKNLTQFGEEMAMLALGFENLKGVHIAHVLTLVLSLGLLHVYVQGVKMQFNPLVYGAYGSGKSFMCRLLQEFFIDGTVESVQSESGKANHVASNAHLQDKIFVWEEMSPSVLSVNTGAQGGNKSVGTSASAADSGQTELAARMRAMLTSLKIQFTRLEPDTDSKKWVRTSTTMDANCCLAGCFNGLPSDVPRNMGSRFVELMTQFSTHPQRSMLQRMSESTPQELELARTQFGLRWKRQQIMFYMVCKFIFVDGMMEVDLTDVNAFISDTMDALNVGGGNLSEEQSRPVDQVKMFVRVLCIWDALVTFLDSPVSPIRDKPVWDWRFLVDYNFEDLLIARIEHAVFAIDVLSSSWQDPCHYEAINALKEHFKVDLQGKAVEDEQEGAEGDRDSGKSGSKTGKKWNKTQGKATKQTTLDPQLQRASAFPPMQMQRAQSDGLSDEEDTKLEPDTDRDGKDAKVDPEQLPVYDPRIEGRLANAMDKEMVKRGYCEIQVQKKSEDRTTLDYIVDVVFGLMKKKPSRDVLRYFFMKLSTVFTFPDPFDKTVPLPVMQIKRDMLYIQENFVLSNRKDRLWTACVEKLKLPQMRTMTYLRGIPDDILPHVFRVSRVEVLSEDADRNAGGDKSEVSEKNTRYYHNPQFVEKNSRNWLLRYAMAGNTDTAEQIAQTAPLSTSSSIYEFRVDVPMFEYLFEKHLLQASRTDEQLVQAYGSVVDELVSRFNKEELDLDYFGKVVLDMDSDDLDAIQNWVQSDRKDELTKARAQFGRARFVEAVLLNLDDTVAELRPYQVLFPYPELFANRTKTFKADTRQLINETANTMETRDNEFSLRNQMLELRKQRIGRGGKQNLGDSPQSQRQEDKKWNDGIIAKLQAKSRSTIDALLMPKSKEAAAIEKLHEEEEAAKEAAELASTRKRTKSKSKENQQPELQRSSSSLAAFQSIASSMELKRHASRPNASPLSSGSSLSPLSMSSAHGNAKSKTAMRPDLCISRPGEIVQLQHSTSAASIMRKRKTQEKKARVRGGDLFRALQDPNTSPEDIMRSMKYTQNRRKGQASDDDDDHDEDTQPGFNARSSSNSNSNSSSSSSSSANSRSKAPPRRQLTSPPNAPNSAMDESDDGECTLEFPELPDSKSSSTATNGDEDAENARHEFPAQAAESQKQTRQELKAQISDEFVRFFQERKAADGVTTNTRIARDHIREKFGVRIRKLLTGEEWINLVERADGAEKAVEGEADNDDNDEEAEAAAEIDAEGEAEHQQQLADEQDDLENGDEEDEELANALDVFDDDVDVAEDDDEDLLDIGDGEEPSDAIDLDTTAAADAKEIESADGAGNEPADDNDEEGVIVRPSRKRKRASAFVDSDNEGAASNDELESEAKESKSARIDESDANVQETGSVSVSGDGSNEMDTSA